MYSLQRCLRGLHAPFPLSEPLRWVFFLPLQLTHTSPFLASRCSRLTLATLPASARRSSCSRRSRGCETRTCARSSRQSFPRVKAPFIESTVVSSRLKPKVDGVKCRVTSLSRFKFSNSRFIDQVKCHHMTRRANHDVPPSPRVIAQARKGHVGANLALLRDRSVGRCIRVYWANDMRFYKVGRGDSYIYYGMSFRQMSWLQPFGKRV